MGREEHGRVLHRSCHGSVHPPFNVSCFSIALNSTGFLCPDFLKLATYFTFFIVILTNFGLPFNILRDVYLTLRSFIGRVKTLVQYTRATSRMDERYPDATREEMDAMEDRVCIICREEMVWFGRDGQDGEAEVAAGGEGAGATTGGEGGGARRRRPRRRREGDRPKKLSCNHCFHLNCLKSWLERQQNCPTWCVALWLPSIFLKTLNQL
jgi:E3 ubiquitin-protein ligase synoviolin